MRPTPPSFPARGLLLCSLWLAATVPVAARPAAPGPVPSTPASATPASSTPAANALDHAAFDAHVEQVRARFEVPGVAVAIVKDGQVLLERGWGVRELDQAGAVDAHTLFAIASNTKAFTAAALSMLADEGALSMDDPVVRHLPWFRMSDPYVTAHMRVADLLTHRSGLGLGAGDLLFWPGTDYTTAEVARRLAQVPLRHGFRERYAYDNILYAVATLVVEEVSGQSYAQFLQQRIFDPLGMAGTRINADALRPGDVAATGHARADFTRLEPTFALTWHNASGAGGIYSSVHDMARWMVAQLDGGAYTDADGNGQRLFSAARHARMWSLQSPMDITEPSVPALAVARPDFLGYGEGWIVSTYRGHKLAWHTGGWPGMVSRVTLVPALGLGVVVLTNAESGAAFNAVTMQALDAFLAPGEPTDWIAAYAEAADKARARAEDAWASRLRARTPRSRPSLPLAAYARTYRDAWYGEVEVEQAGERLRMRFSRTPLLSGELQHWHHDTFLVRWDERTLNGDALVTFELDADGQVGQVRMEAASDLSDFSFDFQHLLLRPL